MEEIFTNQQPFQAAQAVFYGAIFCVGAASGLFRAGRDHDYRNLWHLCNIGLVSGAFAFAILGTCYRWVGSPGNDEFFFLAMASLLGLIGKEQDRILRGVVRFAFDKIGVKDVEELEGKDDV